jgi:hypothetical protein
MSLTVYSPVATDALITRLQVTLSSGTFPTRTLEIWRTPFHINCSLLPVTIRHCCQSSLRTINVYSFQNCRQFTTMSLAKVASTRKKGVHLSLLCKTSERTKEVHLWLQIKNYTQPLHASIITVHGKRFFKGIPRDNTTVNLSIHIYHTMPTSTWYCLYFSTSCRLFFQI